VVTGRPARVGRGRLGSSSGRDQAHSACSATRWACTDDGPVGCVCPRDFPWCESGECSCCSCRPIRLVRAGQRDRRTSLIGPVKDEPGQGDLRDLDVRVCTTGVHCISFPLPARRTALRGNGAARRLRQARRPSGKDKKAGRPVHRVFLSGGNVLPLPAGRSGAAGGRRCRAVIQKLAGRAR